MARSRHRFRQVTAPCNVACGSGIVTVNSPTGSTLQCDTWLWDDMPSNSPKRPPYGNSTSGFHFHTSPQSTCHSVPVCEILSKSDQLRHKQELSYRKQIACQLRTQFVEGISVTLKSTLRVTQDHWKRNHWTDHACLNC